MSAEGNTVYFGRDLEAMAFAPRYHQWILDTIAPHLGRDIAEIGAGSGNFTRLLAADPVRRITALEPSHNMFPQLATLQEAHINVQARNSLLANSPDLLTAAFDSVLYINVLEHVDDDAAELQLAWRALKPGGRLVVFVPALQWLYSDFDRLIGHHRRYQKSSLRALARAGGYQIDTLCWFDIAGILPWYANFVLLRRQNIPRAVALYDTLVVPVMKVLEGLVSPPVGKNLLLVGRKP
jgi:SAM-dependent methyltransferase